MTSPAAKPSAPKPKSPYKGTGYWVGQLLIGAVLGFGGLAAGVFLLVAPDEVLAPPGTPVERGQGVMVLLVGVVFTVMFVVMLRAWLRMSKEQRAVYAWAIMQQHATRTDGHPVNSGAVLNDVAIMGVAARAKRGELSVDEIQRLQGLRPDMPYPGSLPGPTVRRRD